MFAVRDLPTALEKYHFSYYMGLLYILNKMNMHCMCAIQGLYMGPNNLCCVTPHFLLSFLCPMSLFIRILLCHVTFYKYFYIHLYYNYILYFISCRSSFSINFQCRLYKFYKILTSLSTVFIKAHVGFYNFLKWLCRTSFFTHVEP